MKKTIYFIVFIAAMMAFTVAFAADRNAGAVNIQNQEKYGETAAQYIYLPESLEVIEDEAFEGTAITNIVLPENVTTIGNRAFANIGMLRSVTIPSATTYISGTAFDGSNQVIIKSDPDSYARKWAKENHLPFSPLTVMYAGAGTTLISASLNSGAKEIPDIASSETDESRKTWRKNEETQVDNTIEIIANHVQGRAPPMAA